MTVFGITGGIGMGKSMSGQLLRSRGIPVVDTDDLARQVVEPGQPGLTAVRDAFGPDILSTDGRLRRDELARRVFSDSAARLRLEKILHPLIRKLWQAQAAAWTAQGLSTGAVVIPLLFETSAQMELDCTICVACTTATQRRRLTKRDWSSVQIYQRIQAQWPVERKIAQADFLVWTEAGLDVHAAQLQRIVRS